MKQIDDITLMAFADGELPDEEAAIVAAAVAEDPVLAEAVAKHKALRGTIDEAFKPLADEPLPQSVKDVLPSAQSDTGTSKEEEELPDGTVVAFPASRRMQRRYVPVLAAAAMVLAALSTTLLNEPAPGVALPTDVAAALDTSLNSLPDGTAGTVIEVRESYQHATGHYCRTFLYTDTQNDQAETPTIGLACQQEGEWQTLAAAPHVPEGAFLPAGEAEETAVDALLNDMAELPEGGEEAFLKHRR